MTTTTDRPTLSSTLAAHTADAHARAESRGFVTQLLEGYLSADAVVALLAQSLPIYDALERQCRLLADDPRLSPLLDPRLDRAECLRRDLAHHAASGRECAVVLPATEAYVALVARSDAPALVGHHYVRYLGDLSGGQIIKTLVRRHYDLDGGLSFYDFEIDRIKAYKDDYRRRADALPLEADERKAALAAAGQAFELNTELFDELSDLTA